MVCASSARSSVGPPLESDAIMIRIGKELNKLRTWEESSTSAAETISIGLSGIADLYKCIRDMLRLPLTCQVLSLHQHKQCVGELLEASSKLLEACSATSGMALQLKESSGALRLALGGAREEGLLKPSLSGYLCSRKKIAKATKETLSSLRMIGGESLVSLEFDADERVSAAIQALRCITILSISVHENLVSFLGSKPKAGGKRSLLSKIIGRGKGACEGEEVSWNELENVDVALCGLSTESDAKLRLARKRLQALESGIEGIESGLESVFRELTQTRGLLLKISSPKKIRRP